MTDKEMLDPEEMTYQGERTIESEKNRLDELKDKFESRIRRHDLSKSEVIRNPELLEEVFVTFLQHVQENKEESTTDTRTSDISKLIQFLIEKDAHVFPQPQKTFITDFINWGGVSENTKQSRYYTLKMFYDYCVQTNLDDPFYISEDRFKFEDTKPFKENILNDNKPKIVSDRDDEVRFLEKNEVRKLVENVPPKRETRNKLIIRLMYQTGARPNEIVSIRYNPDDEAKSDIETDERKITLRDSKTGKARDMWYQPSLDWLMDEWINYKRESYPSGRKSDYLFVSHVNEQLDPSRINKIVKKAAENAGIQSKVYTNEDRATGIIEDGEIDVERKEVTAYVLRHTYAVHSLRSNMDVRTLRDQLGHSDIKMTMKYLWTVEEQRKKDQRTHGPTLD